MNRVTTNPSKKTFLAGRHIASAGWWLLLLTSWLYGGYALAMGSAALLAFFGWPIDTPERTIPSVFIFHALAGGLLLLIGPLQFNGRLRGTFPALHKTLGKIYVVCLWLTSLSSLALSLFFDVTPLSKVIFAVLAMLWFTTTTVGYTKITRGQMAAHRRWMMRSFSLSFFFVTFSFWVPTLTDGLLPQNIAYPLAIFLSWSVNLAVAELIIRTVIPGQQSNDLRPSKTARK